MTLVSKLEAALIDAGGELTAGEQVLAGWISRLIHHHKAGDVIPSPPQAGVGDGANFPGSGNAATPVVTPAPPLPAPRTVAIRADGAMQIPEIFTEKVHNPKWAQVPDWFFIKDALNANLDDQQTRNVQGNLAEALFLTAGPMTDGTYKWDARGLNLAYQFDPHVGSPVGQRGDVIPDALSFPGDNPVAGFVAPGLADMQRFVDSCNAANAAAIARGEHADTLTGIPVLHRSN
jgi:hypothetical protein